jgi:hypothetical protein
MKMNRRELLRATTLSSLGRLVDVRREISSTATLQYRPEYARKEIPPFQIVPYRGESYEDTVPDTLDLQERAELAIHGMTSITDPRCDYEIFWLADFFRNPPVMLHDFSDWCQNVEGIMEVLPLLRTATGSELNSEVDAIWMRTLLESIGSDGLCYIPLNGRPWGRIKTAGIDPVWKPDASVTWSGDPRISQVANACTSQRAIATMTVYYLRDHNSMWKATIEKMIDRLSQLTIEREDYCYFPAGSCEENAKINQRADMPVGSLWGCSWNSRTIQGLSQYFKVTGYEPARELAGKLAKYTRYHGQIFDSQGRWLLDPEAKGRKLYPDIGGIYEVEGLQFGGHGHGHGIALVSLMEYAEACGDKDLQKYCKAAFEWALNPGAEYGVSRTVGWFPEWYLPGYQASESCIDGDMLALAVKLSRVGAGDYWDDIDRWIRNHFAEAQLLRPEPVYQLAQDQPHRSVNENETADRVPERSVGVWAGWASGNEWATWIGIQHCCTGNAPRALYYVWSEMVERRNDILRIHLLLNRASSWADVYSDLPFQGRVDVKMKQECKNLMLRAPEWVESNNSQVACQLNGTIRQPIWNGRYVEIENLRAGDRATLTFPVPVRTVQERIGAQTYTLVIKGNTVVSIDPPGNRMPLYASRTSFLENKEAPRRKVRRFVAETEVRW